MHIKDVEKLKAWLLRRLSPLCDADPAALSKYIVALLRKEKPRSALKELCINQLEVFLAKETPSFVDRLFLSLDTESYLSGSKDNSPLSTGTTNQTTASNSKVPVQTSNKLTAENSTTNTSRGTSEQSRRSTDDTRHREVDDDDRDFRRARSRHGSPLSVNDSGQRKRRIDVEPPKRSIRQRLGPKEDDLRNNRRPHPSTSSSSRRRSRSRSRSSTPEYNGGQDREDNGNSNVGRKRTHNSDQSKQQASAPKRQRCKDYDEKGMCLLGEQCPFDHGVDPVVITGPLPPPYPPPPHFPPPLGMPPAPPTLTNTSNGGLLLPIQPPSVTSADCYNPEEPSLNPTPPTKVLPPPPIHPSLIPLRPGFHTLPPPPGLPGLPPQSSATPTMSNQMGGATGLTNKPSANLKTPFRLSDTLVLRKIPKELNTITKLSGHFEKFGTIVNLQVRYENDPESAIVQFTTPQEARKAHDATEAVLNNRFIKVYYLKNTSGQSSYNPGQKENFLKTSTPEEIALQVIQPPGLISKNMSTSSTEITPTTTQTTPTQSIPPHMTKSKHQVSDNSQTTEPSVHVKKQLARQEALHNAAQKRLELQKKSQSLLEAQIAQQKLLLNKLEKSGNSLSSEERSKVIDTLKSLSSSISKHKQTLSSATKTAHVKPRPHNATPTTTTTKHNPDSLQQTAESLRNEARQLGILPGAAPPRAKSDDSGDLRNKLESKPRQLLVINSVNDKELLIKYFESFGGLNQVENDPNSTQNLIFTFRNRTIAEKAAQGSIFKGKPLIMKWYEPKPPATPQTVSNSKEHVKDDRGKGVEDNDSIINEEDIAKHVRTVSISNEIDVEGLLDEGEPLIDVLTPPNQSKPRVVHLLDDDEDEEDRSWRR